MSRVLILYATSHGQTRAIGHKLAADLRGAGHDVVLHDLARHPPGPTGFDAVVLGSRVHLDRHARALYQYVRSHRTALQPDRTWFYTVSMSAADGGDDPGGHIQGFIRRSGFEPHRSIAFAGALAYTKYDPLTRFIMRRISANVGRETVTSVDHEHTDWAAVAGFAGEIADAVAPPGRSVVLPAPLAPAVPPPTPPLVGTAPLPDRPR